MLREKSLPHGHSLLRDYLLLALYLISQECYLALEARYEH